jgi:hypothetical protein
MPYFPDTLQLAYACLVGETGAKVSTKNEHGLIIATRFVTLLMNNVIHE